MSNNRQWKELYTRLEEWVLNELRPFQHGHRCEKSEWCCRDRPCTCGLEDILNEATHTTAEESEDAESKTPRKRTTVTREAPIRGSVGDYQDWLIEQLQAGVDGYFTGADINDLSWAKRVIRAEERATRRAEIEEAIRSARDQGLYEAAEHLTSSVIEIENPQEKK
jgi:hypothetical protein